jgi:predicted GIY-YIG superfamily endonuclease
MAQLLLFPDPRPLVERLGPEFFRSAPNSPGVYLMRGRTDVVLYVGKAKNLRKRLGNYRVANPDRLPKRHLRLLRAVERIELRPCASEAAAIANEAALLRSLRPRFNRAGTWPGQSHWLSWLLDEEHLQLRVSQSPEQPAWHSHGPMGASATHLHSALARVLWLAVHPGAQVMDLPQGWFGGRARECCSIPLHPLSRLVQDQCGRCLRQFFDGAPESFCDWIMERTASWTHRFDMAVRDGDLETLNQFADSLRAKMSGGFSYANEKNDGPG